MSYTMPYMEGVFTQSWLLLAHVRPSVCTDISGKYEGVAWPAGGSEKQAGPSLLGLMWHASDTVARPLVGNRAIERVARPACDPAALPFPALVRTKSPTCQPAASGQGTVCSVQRGRSYCKPLILGSGTQGCSCSCIDMALGHPAVQAC